MGEIVHGHVDEFHGAPNKNIGPSFLVAWNLTTIEEEGRKERITKTVDMALLAFSKIVAALEKCNFLAEYRTHPGLLNRIRDYRVQCGFGLHKGWRK